MTSTTLGDGPVPTVAGAFRAACATWGDRPFLHVLPETAAAYGQEAGTWSYGRAAAAVASLEARYRALGFGPGHRVGLMLGNRPSFFLHWLALNAAGASVVPLSAELRPPELDYLLAHSRLLHIVAADERAAQEAASRAPQHVTVARPDQPPPAVPPATGDGAECALLYTSGTTGQPKGCVLSQDYFLGAGAWYIGSGGLSAIRPGEDRLITALPMTHMNAMAFSTMAMMLSGGCIVPLDRFHPSTWWDSVRDSRATIVHYLGVMPAMLLARPAQADDAAHAVRFGFGAGVDPRRHAEFEARFGFPLLEAWAMTETGPGAVIIANQVPRTVGQARIGRPGPALDIRLVDEAGLDVPPGAAGELLVRAAGPDPRAGFFTGYLHDALASAEAWAGGWFHTGDILRREPDGELAFIDRRKNVIRRSGENISPIEVESVLRRDPSVRDAAVAATPDPLRGEEVLACIVPHHALVAAEEHAAAASIVQSALAELSYHKVPGWVAFVDRLPLTSSQKIQRGALKAWAATLPGQPGCIDTRPLKRRPA